IGDGADTQAGKGTTGKSPAAAPKATPEQGALKAVASEWINLSEAVDNKDLGKKFNSDVRDVLQTAQAGAEKNGSLSAAEKKALQDLVDAYREDNPEGIKKVHDYLREKTTIDSAQSVAEKAGSGAVVLDADPAHKRLSEGKIAAVSMTSQGQEPI